MAVSENKVRVQAMVDSGLERKLNELADRMGVSQSQMMYWLLEAAIEDNEWIIGMVTGKFATKMREVLGKKRSGAKAKASPATS
ncbi:MAG: hypothetical protein WD069_04370 [Planctomycetales bacterium]